MTSAEIQILIDSILNVYGALGPKKLSYWIAFRTLSRALVVLISPQDTTYFDK
jgi:hypothetical protein